MTAAPTTNHRMAAGRTISRGLSAEGMQPAATIRRGLAFAVAVAAVVRFPNLKSPAQETAVPAIDRRALAPANAPSDVSKSPALSICALGDA